MLRTSTSPQDRLRKLHPDDHVVSALINNNFHSAVQIAGTAPSHFVRLMAPHLGGNEDTAREIHRRAIQVRSTVLHAWANVKTAAQSVRYKAMAPTNIGDKITAQIEQLPSYAELFGTLDYYECEECRSIFGPAAYLVDLLRIIDTYVTQPNQDTIPADMLLDKRRSDLGQIPLTCAMANDTFPQLRIVNERLGALAHTLLEIQEGNDLFEKLATLCYPFNTPFHLPLTKIGIALSQVNLTLADIYSTFGAAAADTVRVRLALTPATYQFVTTSLADKPDDLATSYGVLTSQLDGLAKVDMLLSATGMELGELQALLAQDLSAAELSAGVATNFFINGQPDSKALTYVPANPNDGVSERIDNLENGSLDRLSRFVRLGAQLDWPYDQLDWALRIASGDDPPNITSATLGTLADMIDLAALAKLDIATVCVLLGPVKTYGEGSGSASSAPFDTIFNDPRVRGVNPPYRPKDNSLNSLYKSDIWLWNVGGTAAADVSITTWLSGALRVQTSVLNHIASAIFPGSGAVRLTIDNLSALYRHAVLLRATGLPADQHFLFMKLGNWWKIALTASELRQLLEQAAWLAGSRATVTIYQIDYFLNGGPSVPVSAFVDPLYTVSAVSDWLNSVWQATANLVPQDKAPKLEGLLGVFFGIDTDLLNAVMTLVTKARPPQAGKTWQDAFLACASQQSAPSSYVSDVLAAISRWLVLARAIGVPLALLNSLASSANAKAYGMSELTLATIAFNDVITLSTFVQQMAAFQDVSNGLISYVELTAQENPPSDPTAELARVTQWDPVQLTVLLPKVAGLGRTAAIAELQRKFALMRRLGADFDFIDHIIKVSTNSASTWNGYLTLTDLVLHKVQGIIPETQWLDIAAQIDGAVAERIRNVLAPLVLSQIKKKHPKINNLRKLSEYMLLDVEISGALQISYIREALNAAQLYLHRCRQRLEDGIVELDIPEAWWEWIMNYRVWEANREIFLYPENYIDPTLRKSQTRLFTDLRNRLQQDAVTDQAVEAAYHDYLDNLCKLAQLVYVDAYHGTVDDPMRGLIDTQFLFARTATEPYTYYYISYDTNVWSEWKQIDVTIAAALVTPVYAFNHLFLFWVDLTKSKPSSTDGTNNSGVAYTATIKYSFTKFDGSWIQPQDLITDEVVYFMPSDDKQQDLLKEPLSNQPELFRMTDIFWNKVAVNVIPAAGSEPERLCVMYGPFLDKGLSAKPFILPSQPASTINQTSSKRRFEQKVFDISATYDHLVKAPMIGQLPMMNSTVIDRDLNKSCLKRPNEVIVLEKDYGETTPPLFKPEIDMLAGTLRLVATTSAYQANYLTDYTPPSGAARSARKVTPQSFVSNYLDEAGSKQCHSDLLGNHIIDENGVLSPSFGPATDLSFLFAGAPQKTKDQLTFEIRKTLFGCMADPELFGALPVTTSRLVSVKNQPGSFLLETGSDAYLLTPRGARYAPLSKGTDVIAQRSSTIVYALYFVPVSEKGYKTIYTDLTANYVVQKVNDDYGWLSPNFNVDTSLDFLFGGESDKEKARLINNVRRILLGLPSLTKLRYSGNRILHIVHEDAFVAPHLSPPLTLDNSKQAYQDLLSNQIINANGVVTPTFHAATELPFVLQGAPQALRDHVRTVLLSLPKLIQPNSFISEDIDGNASQEAFSALVEHKVIDEAGMVTASFSRLTDLSYLFPKSAVSNKMKQIKTVRVVLLGYYDATYQIDPHALRFDVQRVSARASSRELSAKMFVGGLPELLSLETQNAPVVPKMPFDQLAPNVALLPPAQADAAQIDFGGPYGEYYWELFFHAPMLVSEALALNQQYADAKRWLEYILNPTATEQFVQPASFVTADISAQDAQSTYEQLLALNLLEQVSDGNARVTAKFTAELDLKELFQNVTNNKRRALMIREVANVLSNFQLTAPVSHFWQFRPFRNHTLASLKGILTDPAQIVTYTNDPFDPHAIARLRIGAYEKVIVMKYVDNLIAWGDMLFTQYTWESVTNASLLYTFANDILGDKPRDLGPMQPVKPMCFNDIKDHSKQIPQFLLDLEHWLSEDAAKILTAPAIDEAFNALDTYFCVPENTKLTGYWDRVTDRLYKIRHGLNIDGVAAPLTLFDSPIDPMALVKLAASGAGALGVAGAGTLKINLQYRFRPLFEQAMQLTNTVIQLGQALLAALERHDAEQLETLRQNQELAILDLTTTIKQKQIDQLQATLDGLEKSQQKAQGEVTYYANLKSGGLSSQEVISKTLMAEAILFQSATVPIRGMSIPGYLAPSIFGLADGGMEWGDAVSADAEILSSTSQSLQLASQLTAITAEQARRSDDWQHQIELSKQDVAILQKQIDMIHAQIDMAKQELAVHQKSIEQANTVSHYLRSRFTSAELYQWMAGRVAGIYFQAYSMAVDFAKKAELAYQYETAQRDTFINLGYWDSLKKGLLAGEALNFSLLQLRQAYMTGHVRRLQISKTISLLQLDPQQILNLRMGKEASFKLTETMFDFDFPGHYARQISSIAISIPAVVGPYQNINATLTQTKNTVALTPDKENVEYLIAIEHPSSTLPPRPDTLREDWLPSQSIAISRGLNDNGMFELDFASDHYMPFEGTGAVSSWTLSIPPENNRIYLDQLTDVVIELKYTALDGLGRDTVNDILRSHRVQFESKLYLNLRQMSAGAWQAFMSLQGESVTQTLMFTMTRGMFPYFRSITANRAAIRLTTTPGVLLTGQSFVTLSIGDTKHNLSFGTDGIAMVPSASSGPLNLSDKDFLAPWSLEVTLSKVPSELIENHKLNPQTFLNFEVILSYSADVLGKK